MAGVLRRLLPCMERREVGQESVEIFIVLVGGPNSGKTTILRQLELQYHIPDETARQGAAGEVRARVRDTLTALCSVLVHRLSHDSTVFVDLELVLMLKEDSEQYYSAATRLCSAPEVTEMLSSLHLGDNATYFLSRLQDVRGQNYVPTDGDLLRRGGSAQAGETKFERFDVRFHLFNAGAVNLNNLEPLRLRQSGSALLFVCSASSFDEFVVSADCSRQNCLQESLQLFSQYCAHPLLSGVEKIVFINKEDVLRQKLRCGADLALYFPEFRSLAESVDPLSDCAELDHWNNALYFISSLLRKICPDVFSHYTTAVVSSNDIDWYLYNTCRDFIQRSNLRRHNLLIQ